MKYKLGEKNVHLFTYSFSSYLLSSYCVLALTNVEKISSLGLFPGRAQSSVEETQTEAGHCNLLYTIVEVRMLSP